jgi:hypothetical protein
MITRRCNMAILVVSCDDYADLWPIFFNLFQRFWKECPFKLYLLTNELQPAFEGVTVLRTGKDRSWSDNLMVGLNSITEDYVMLFLEDLLLCEPVRMELLMPVLSWFWEQRGNYLRLVCRTPADKSVNEFLGEISPGSIYRTSTVMSIWKKDVLARLLKTGESAWEFEVHGSARSDTYPHFFSVWNDLVTIINAVIKGKWDRSALKRVRLLGCQPDLRLRPSMTPTETFFLYAKTARASAFRLIPGKYRRRIKHLALRGRYYYKRC